MEDKLIAAYKALREVMTDPAVKGTPDERVVSTWMLLIRDKLVQIESQTVQAKVDAVLA